MRARARPHTRGDVSKYRENNIREQCSMAATFSATGCGEKEKERESETKRSYLLDVLRYVPLSVKNSDVYRIRQNRKVTEKYKYMLSKKKIVKIRNVRKR